MHPAFLPLPRRLLYALKPASWPKLLVPMVVGQALGVMSSGTWSWGGAAVGLAFTVAMLCYLVLLNDSASKDETARVWDAQSGKPLTDPLKHDREVESARFSPDGTRIVTVSGNVARVWDAQTGKPVTEPM